MAPEAVHQRLYSSQSDVWSYGILLWEIMTMGESPFKDVPIEAFPDALNNGIYPSQPINCPVNVYTIMLECWRFFPEERPTWDLLVNAMHNLCASKMFSSIFNTYSLGNNRSFMKPHFEFYPGLI